jgi:hypothetical protein
MAGFSLERAFARQQGDVDPGQRTDPEIMRGMLWILPAILVALVIAGLIVGLT